MIVPASDEQGIVGARKNCCGIPELNITIPNIDAAGSAMQIWIRSGRGKSLKKLLTFYLNNRGVGCGVSPENHITQEGTLMRTKPSATRIGTVISNSAIHAGWGAVHTDVESAAKTILGENLRFRIRWIIRPCAIVDDEVVNEKRRAISKKENPASILIFVYYILGIFILQRE